jgi:hypothetical protein
MCLNNTFVLYLHLYFKHSSIQTKLMRLCSIVTLPMFIFVSVINKHKKTECKVTQEAVGNLVSLLKTVINFPLLFLFYWKHKAVCISLEV